MPTAEVGIFIEYLLRMEKKDSSFLVPTFVEAINKTAC